MIGLDTNLLVRYVTDDDAEQSPLAGRFIEHELHAGQPGYISLVALAELAWVLRSRYQATVAEVAVVIEELASDHRFRLQDVQAVWLALEMVEDGGTDFPDALICALHGLAGCTRSVTFDRNAARLPGMTLLE